MGRNAIAANGTRSAEQLAAWIERDMRMSHVYQPGVLRALLDAGGVATVRQIAQRTGASLSQPPILGQLLPVAGSLCRAERH